jgi:hypothetical protein
LPMTVDPSAGFMRFLGSPGGSVDTCAPCPNYTQRFASRQTGKLSR